MTPPPPPPPPRGALLQDGALLDGTRLDGGRPCADAAPLPACTVVIPARNAAATLPHTLAALGELPAGWDVIVVDDRSTDRTAEVARAQGARVVPCAGHDAYAARNTGIRAARTEMVALLDADVVAPGGVVAALVRRVADGEADCVFAVYDEGRHLRDAASSYKNFWIRHTTLRAPRPLRWINTSLAVLRRADLDRAGGFGPHFTVRRGGGDLEFGRRLAEHGARIAADDRARVTHLKHFGLRGLVRNDFRRARGWLRLALEARGWRATAARPGLANVTPAFSLGAVASCAGLALLAGGGPGTGAAPALAGGALLGAGLGVNAGFLAAAARARVPRWPLFPALLLLDQVACVAGLLTEAAARVRHGWRPRR